MEHDFVALLVLVGPQYRSMSDDRVNDLLVVATEAMPKDVEEQIVGATQRLWCKWCGRTRDGQSNPEPKLHRWKQGNHKASAHSEAKWLRNHSCQIAVAAAKWAKAGGRVRSNTELEALTREAWTPEMDQEVKSQEKCSSG